MRNSRLKDAGTQWNALDLKVKEAEKANVTKSTSRWFQTSYTKYDI